MLGVFWSCAVVASSVYCFGVGAVCNLAMYCVYVHIGCPLALCGGAVQTHYNSVSFCRKWGLNQTDINVLFKSLSKLCDTLMNVFSKVSPLCLEDTH